MLSVGKLVRLLIFFFVCQELNGEVSSMHHLFQGKKFRLLSDSFNNNKYLIYIIKEHKCCDF